MAKIKMDDVGAVLVLLAVLVFAVTLGWLAYSWYVPVGILYTCIVAGLFGAALIDIERSY